MLRDCKNREKRPPKKTLKEGVSVAIKNKGSQKHKRGRKKKKYQRPWKSHPKTNRVIKDQEIQANKLEGTNASIRRKNSAFRRKTNTYSKKKSLLQRTLDISWVIRNFVVRHFTTKKVPAVAQGIIAKPMSIVELMTVRVRQ